MAPRGDLQRKARRTRREIPQEGIEGFVNGALRSRKWQDKEGVDHYGVEIQITQYEGTLLFLDRKAGGEHVPMHRARMRAKLPETASLKSVKSLRAARDHTVCAALFCFPCDGGKEWVGQCPTKRK